MIRSRSAFQVDLVSGLAAVALVVIGILFIFSSGVTATGQVVSSEYLRQIGWAVSGLVLMALVVFLDYRVLQQLAFVAFGVILVLLVFTLLFGRVVNGARSWIGIAGIGGQPSEFAKLALVFALARYFTSSWGDPRTLGGFVGGLAIALVPTGLVLLQPDLGTAMVYIPVFLFVAYAAGTRMRYLVFVAATGITAALFTVLPVWEVMLSDQPRALITAIGETGAARVLTIGAFLVFAVGGVAWLWTHRRYFYWISYTSGIIAIAAPLAYVARRMLQDYQIMRLIVFLDPYVDPRGAGWNIIQSTTAVGSGGPFGRGFLQGTQSHFQFLPQQSTDFIFSILAEEWGFLGVIALFTLYGVILGRGLYVMASAKDGFASMAVAGIVGIFFFHFMVNVGMAVGIMPITGIPLLLVSYGGSSLWSALIGIGVIMSVYQHRYLF